jgi:ATP-dependent Clp protease adaptor protein ClpS
MNNAFIHAAGTMQETTMGPVSNGVDGDLALKPKIVPKLEKPKQFNVVMLNDDYTPMNYVEGVLMRYFNKNSSEAHSIMMEIHKKGRAIAEKYASFDVADTKAAQVIADAQKQGHPFWAEAQPAP